MLRSWEARVVHTTGLVLPEMFFQTELPKRSPGRTNFVGQVSRKPCWARSTQYGSRVRRGVYQEATGYEAYHLQLKLASVSPIYSPGA